MKILKRVLIEMLYMGFCIIYYNGIISLIVFVIWYLVFLMFLS